MSTLPATQTDAGLPALASTPAALGGLDGGDIALPKLYKGEFQASLVQEGTVPVGSIFRASGPDDPDPEVLIKDATKANEKGVLVHVLAVRKGLSMQDENNELQTWQFGDPNAHPDAKPTFTYFLALPEIDEDVPVKVTFAKTSVPTAKRINFHLLKHNGAPHELAFRFTLKKREAEKNGQKFRWFVWVEKLEAATPENVEIAGRLAAMAASASTPQSTTERSAGSVPAI